MLVNRIVILLVIFTFLSCVQKQNTETKEFKTHVKTQKKPWSHLKFRNNPDNFQFAIVSDRTGGMRPGVFPKALKKLNLLEPEFVITVGDLIAANRHTKDEKTAHKMWDEVEDFVSYLDMPFFYLAGNHDNGSPLLTKVWKERFGVEYYHFLYKDVLFMCLNAQDNESFSAVMEKEQLEWAQKVINENQDVRWTFIFIHQPVWMYEKGLPISESGSLPPRDTGWKVIEKALEGRKHTAFAGHVHQYVKYSTDKPSNNYYSLATTGGGNKLRGNNFGEFDHATWITMTESGPKIANLRIDGILPEDINDENQELFRGLVTSSMKVKSLQPYQIEIEISIDNQLKRNLNGHIELNSGNPQWFSNLNHEHISVQSGEKFKKKLALSFSGKAENFLPLPKIDILTKDENGRPFDAQLKLTYKEIEQYLKTHKIKLPKEFLKEKNKQLKKKK